MESLPADLTSGHFRLVRVGQTGEEAARVVFLHPRVTWTVREGGCYQLYTDGDDTEKQEADTLSVRSISRMQGTHVIETPAGQFRVEKVGESAQVDTGATRQSAAQIVKGR